MGIFRARWNTTRVSYCPKASAAPVAKKLRRLERQSIREVNTVRPTSVMKSPRSAVPIAKGLAANPNTKTVFVGGRELTVGPSNHYFDDKDQAVDFGEDKPLGVNEFMMSPQLST